MAVTILNSLVHCQSNSRRSRNRVNVPCSNQFAVDCLFVRIKKKRKAKKKKKKMTLTHIKTNLFTQEQVVLATVTHIYSSFDSKEGHCIV